jgi:hypothetical protein
MVVVEEVEDPGEVLVAVVVKVETEQEKLMMETLEALVELVVLVEEVEPEEVDNSKKTEEVEVPLDIRLLQILQFREYQEELFKVLKEQIKEYHR